MIYNQHKIPKDQWRYGFRSSGETGCGWIATYNALRLLRYRVKPEELIRYYERQLPLIHGNAGTSCWGPAVCFTQWEFPLEICIHRNRMDAVAKNSDVCILFYRWRKGCKIGAHFVAVQYDGEKFTGYNTFRNSEGPDDWGESLEGFLKKQGFFGPVLMGIRDKRNTSGK